MLQCVGAWERNKIRRERETITQEKLEEDFLFACRYGCIQEVEEFFINSRRIPNINTCNGLALRQAAMGGKVDIFHFLLTSHKLPERVRMGEHIFLCFHIAKKYKNPHISNYLKNSPLFQNFLIQREKNQLDNIIENKSSHKKNFKI